MTINIMVDDEVIELSASEARTFELQRTEDPTVIELANTKAAAKAALLERLGITADEAALLLG